MMFFYLLVSFNVPVESKSNPSTPLNFDFRQELVSFWEKIQGTVTYKGDPLCAMVLVKGQYMFSCDPDGEYQLSVPLDPNGEITLFVFVDGLQPFKEIIRP